MGFPRQEYWSGLPFPSFSTGSSQPRDWTHVSCIGQWSLYYRATKQTPYIKYIYIYIYNFSLPDWFLFPDQELNLNPLQWKRWVLIPGKWSVSESSSVVSDCLWPHGLTILPMELSTQILEWVAISFSRVSSQPRDWTQVSHIAGGFFTS